MTQMTTASTRTVTPRAAVKRFLYDVVDVVEQTYPMWEKRLLTFLEDTHMDFEERRRMFEIQPVRHYYAVVVGMPKSGKDGKMQVQCRAISFGAKASLKERESQE